MQTQLCWFRNDLRVRDNPALSNALASGPTRA
ncbi:MAG: deoxyribodipyrimidine photo-lyase, partial [Gammaproteobacteria bacterium]|nr:deoxyribodipyrimidine photo-lyase [Gammaproteobacteria bacterium]